MSASARTRWLALVVVAGVIVAMSTSAAARPATPGSGGLAPVLLGEHPAAIADRYIVVLRPSVLGPEKQAAVDLARQKGGTIAFQYDKALSGFAATLPAAAVEALRALPAVEYIEADLTVTAFDTQTNPPWGLDRIDQRNLPLNQSYVYNATGTGVTAYIIDTGIRFSHTQFGGRAVSGFDAIDGGSADDCNGHGTHVAGTVGGSTYGVAKAVGLVGVRVLNCQGSGTNSQVIAGIDWVTGDHSSGERAVANMSLGGGASSALDTAVVNSINDGVTYAIAAGNGDIFGNPLDACTQSPARVPAAITVSATDSSDTKASWANYGTCLDIFAPGVSVTSAWYTSNTATNTISGTSMATPHVAGVAALYLQGTAATPQQVRDTIVNSATTGVVVNPGSGSPNRLLYSLLGSAPPPPPPPPPTGCSSLPEQFSGSLSGTGDSDYHPNGTYFYTGVSGTHRGCLDGPTGVDFDLYLQKWNGYFWSTVASGLTSAPDENVTYNGTAGYYRWRVYSYSGSGSYTFGMQRP